MACLPFVFIQVKKRPDFEDKTPVTQLAFSFMTSLTITALNSIVPIIFKKIVKLESYSFAVEVNVTLVRYIYNLPVIQYWYGVPFCVVFITYHVNTSKHNSII